MSGLLSTLNLGARSLMTQQKGVEVAGHNLANVNNPAYARQRVTISSAPAVQTALGQQGNGVEAIDIVRLRDDILDRQITVEGSVRESLEARRRALEDAQARLGQMIDRQASGAAGSAGALGVGGQQGIAEGLADLFNAFQSVSASPGSLAEREVLLSRAGEIASRFNRTAERLGGLHDDLNRTVESQVSQANTLLTSIAQLNDRVADAELAGRGTANDLRDLRQQKLEELAKIFKFETGAGDNGTTEISVGGVSLVSEGELVESLESYDAGGGRVLVRAAGSDSQLQFTGGSLHGVIDARDADLKRVRNEVDSLASLLITEVNAQHRDGFSLAGTTGADFFSGNGAASIRVSTDLLQNPALVQLAGVTDAAGDNKIALAIAGLSEKRHAALNNRTFSESFAATVSTIGQALSSANAALSDQRAVEEMLQRRRESISGVSLDEEMTDLTRFQKAFAASARLITTVDEMLDTILTMKR